MGELFWTVLHLSLLASVVTLIAIPLRWLFRTCRLPAWLCVALWLAVLVRMLAPPGVLTSSFSLLRWSAPAIERRVNAWAAADMAPQAGTAPGRTPAAQTTPIPQDDPPSQAAGNPVLPVTPAVRADSQPVRTPGPSGFRVWDALPWVWAAGVLALWAYAAVSTVRLRLRLRTAVRRGADQTLRWESDRIPAPFVFGLFRPKVYVPTGLEGDALEWVLRHERAHLRMGHHRLKPLFFVALALHWFNPLLWLAWALFCRDLEVLCDEQVLKHAPEHRKDYSAALLALAAPRQGLLLPPGFGETGVKDRIKRALRYRAPARWAVVIAGILAVLSICCLGADPVYPSLPGEVPALTVQMYEIQLEADCSASADAPWPDALPEAQITTGLVNPELELLLSLNAGQRAPDQVTCTEYLVAGGQAQAPLERACSGLNGVAGHYWLGLDAREDSSGTGMETRLIVLACTWESGAEDLAVEYAFLLTLPSVKAGELLDEPVIVVNGERLDWTLAHWLDAPYGSMLEITDPQGKGGAVELYVSLEPGEDGGADMGRLSIGSGLSGGGASGTRLRPIDAEEGQYPDQDQHYTLRYTWEDGTEDVYTFTISAYLAMPELDLEQMRIRFPGQEAWSDFGPLLPAPQEWADQDVGGRNQHKTLEGLLLSGTGGFVDPLNGWFVFSIGQGAAHADTYVYRTRDGGHTWQETGRPDPEIMCWYPSCCCFLDNQIAFIAKSHFNGAEVFRTEDGGSTWSQAELPLPSGADGSSAWEAKTILFNGADGLMVVQNYSSSAAGGAAVLNSHDSGKTWAVLELPEAVYDENGRLTEGMAVWDMAPLRVLGDLPSGDITLYGLNEAVTGLPGIVLRRGASLSCFPEIAGPAIPVHSDLALDDYDGDGTQELAVSLATGTGTSGPACQLYLFPWDGAGFLAPAKLEALDTPVQGRFHTEDATMTLETAGRAWLLDFAGSPDLWKTQPPDGMFSTGIYSFDLNPLRLTMYLSPGNYNRPDAAPQYMVRYSARLLYDGGQVTIDGDSGILEALPGEPLREISPTSLSLPLDAPAGWQTDTLTMNGMDGAALMYNSRSGAYELLLTHDYGGTWTWVDPPQPQADDFSPDGTFWPDANNWYYGPVALLGALPEEDICLYCFPWNSGCTGLLLRRGTVLTYLPDVPCKAALNLHMTPAQLALGDYDEDGTEELSAILCVGTGTGVSLHQLLVFEESAGRFLPPADFEKAAWEDMDLHAFPSVPDNAVLGEILLFHAEGSQLSATLGLCNADAPYTADYIGSLECALRYIGDGIQFEMITYVPELAP